MVLLNKRAMMTGHRRIFFIVFSLLLSWSLHAYTALAVPKATALQNEDAMQVSPNGYEVVVLDVDDGELERFLRKNSLLIRRMENPPETVLGLKKLTVDDLGHLQRALATQGYYDAQFDYFIDVRKKPYKVYIKIKIGPMYTVGAFKLKSDPAGNMEVGLLEDNIESLGITLGQPGKAQYLKQAAEKALDQLQRHGYPFAKLKPGGDRIVIDRVSKTIQAAFLISPGPLARFGDVHVDNVAGVTTEFLNARLQWKKGDIYNEDKVLDTVEALYNTRLFKNIRIVHADIINSKTGLMDMYIRADARPKNSAEGNILLSSGSKHDTRLAWEIRNVRGRGEILRVGGAFGSYRKLFEASLIQPDMFLLNLELASRLTVGTNTAPGYYSKGVELQSVGQYPLTRYLLGTAGLGIDMKRAGPRVGGTTPYRYLVVPLMLNYQTPGLNGLIKQGYKASIKATPHARVMYKKMQVFNTMQINQRGFVPVSYDGKLALEPWLNVGMSPGSGKHVMPVHKRFFVGGADSVRGYAYQMAGPLDSGNNPVGGRSSVAFGTELKYYLSEKLAVLTFMDLGTTFNSAFPDFSNQLMWGVGAGFRYETPIGTLRMDVGSPLRRRSADDAVQAYIGLDKKI